MKSTRATRLAASLSLCLATLCSYSQHCLAQVGSPQSGQPASAKPKPSRPPLKNTKNPEFKSQHLTKPIDLVDLPPYAGKKTEFVSGVLFANVKGGPSVTMQFSAQETPKEVLNWYKTALANNQWQMLDNTAGASSLAAMKSKNICHIVTMGPTKKGATCDFVIMFKFYKPTDFPAH